MTTARLNGQKPAEKNFTNHFTSQERPDDAPATKAEAAAAREALAGRDLNELLEDINRSACAHAAAIEVVEAMRNMLVAHKTPEEVGVSLLAAAGGDWMAVRQTLKDAQEAIATTLFMWAACARIEYLERERTKQ